MKVKHQQIKPQTNSQCNGNRQRDVDRNAELFFHHPQDHVVFNKTPKVLLYL